MATSGYTDVVVTSWDTLKFKWTVSTGQTEQQRIETNSTVINWEMWLIAGSSGRISSTASKAWSVNVNGTEYSGTNTVGISNNSSKLLASGTTTIPHDPDGNKTFSYSFSQHIGITFSGSRIETISGSGTGELDYIARASTPSVTGTLQLGQTITIHTNRASGSFDHALYYSWGQLTNQWFASGVGDNTNWTIPKDLANHIPNGDNGTLFIICETYNNGSYIGSKTISMTVYVPDTDEFKPSISEIALSEAMDGLFAKYGAYIQNQSKVYCTITASGAYSSQIASYKAVINGTTYNSNTFTTDYLKLAGTNIIEVTVTDTRGRPRTSTRSFEVLAYAGPEITKFVAHRCEADGTLNEEGDYAKIEIEAKVPTLNNKNGYSYYFQYKDTDATDYTDYAITLTETKADSYANISGSFVIAADGDNSFDYLFALADGFIRRTKSTDIGSAFQLINFNASGKGMAIGKVSEKNALEIAMNIYDKFDTLISNGLAEYDGGTIDPNTTLSHLCLSETNTPNANGFYYIMTFFYGTKSVDANRTQIAIPYIYDISQDKKEIFVRQYVGGTWSEWESPLHTLQNDNLNTGTLAVGETKILDLPGGCFGFVYLRLYTSYCEIYRCWSVMGNNGWAYDANPINSYNYTSGGNADISIYNDNGQIKIKMVNTGTSNLTYLFNRTLNIRLW